MAKLDITNRRFTRFTAIAPAQPRGTHTYWKCVCDCGESREVEIANLTSGRSKSCGCLKRELAVPAAKKRFTTHGDHKSRLYGIHKGMMQRCYLPAHTAYKNYGARGIVVCQEWSKYEKFKEWAVSSGYSDTLTIDRIDSSLGYYPSNCRWASYETQTRNRRKAASPKSSSFIGVSWCSSRSAWRVSISVSGVAVKLPSFDSEMGAAIARDKYITDHGLQGFKMNF